jgi:hypothetical protein
MTESARLRSLSTPGSYSIVVRAAVECCTKRWTSPVFTLLSATAFSTCGVMLMISPSRAEITFRIVRNMGSPYLHLDGKGQNGYGRSPGCRENKVRAIPVPTGISIVTGKTGKGGGAGGHTGLMDARYSQHTGERLLMYW